MEHIVTTIIFIAVFSILIGGGIWAYRNEKRYWNNGHCECGEPWECFGIDSQNARGYHCLNPRHEHPPNLWVSYPGIDTTWSEENGL